MIPRVSRVLNLVLQVVALLLIAGLLIAGLLIVGLTRVVLADMAFRYPGNSLIWYD